MQLPTVETLELSLDQSILSITLNRPTVKNAMSLQMVSELMTIFDQIKTDLSIRAVILRGSEGNFCAGGDIKDMANVRKQLQENTNYNDPIYALNREFGRLLEVANQIPQVLIVILEGAVLGGGFGLACVSDVAMAHKTAQFGLPETSLGLPPAQIAPYVVQRIGLTKARQLALLGARFDGEHAKLIGIVHEAFDSEMDLEKKLTRTIQQVKRCAPTANAVTKQLLLDTAISIDSSLLDSAAMLFSTAVKSDEGTEGTMAFVQKRKPKWAVES